MNDTAVPHCFFAALEKNAGIVELEALYQQAKAAGDEDKAADYDYAILEIETRLEREYPTYKKHLAEKNQELMSQQVDQKLPLRD